METETDPLEGSSYSLNVSVMTEIKEEPEEDEEDYNAMALLELAQCVDTTEEPIVFNTTDAMMNPKTGQMVCLHCLQELETNMVPEHMINEHNYRKIFFKCHICNTKFQDRNLFAMHRKGCQPLPKRYKRKTFKQIIREVEANMDHIDDLDTFSCPICILELPKYSMKDHLIKEHSKPEDTLTCNRCNRNFKSKLTLREHIKLVHESVEDSVECDLCGQKFRSLKYLSNHKRNVHPPGDKIYKCEVCTKQFKSRLSLHQHCKFVHPPPTASVSCPHCHKLFKTNVNLSQHIKVAHK